jgi:hypothetical protein
MKKVVLFVYCLFALQVFAQQKFDLFNYTEPKGYKKESKTSMVTYTKSDEKTGIYCMISLYAQSSSSGDLVKDFDNDWTQLIATPLSISATPQKDNGDEITGWKTYSGAANFEFGGGTSMAILTTAKKDDANVAIIVITNSQTFLTTDVDAFFSTIKLEKPIQTTAASNNNTQVNGSISAKPTSIIGEWLYDDGLISILYDYSGHANNDTYNNDVKMTVKNKITIKADGTYEDYTFYNKGSFKKKEITAKGKYKLSGNSISFTPTYHQYIKNDVVQPKDDARNLRTNNATCAFVFDEKANAWGVKFTAADANSYFPDEIYLNASAYKKTATTNKLATSAPIIKSNTTSSTGNAALNDNNIAGVWTCYRNSPPNYSLSWYYKVFFSNGKSLDVMPRKGLYNYNLNAEQNLSIGHYTFANGKGSNYKSDQANVDDKLILLKPNNLKIDNNTYWKAESITGLKLNAAFTSFSEANNPQLETLPYGEKPKITFYPDGKFKDEGLFNTYLFDKATNPTAAQPGNGTYELKDFSIMLQYEDGRQRQEAFVPAFGGSIFAAKIILMNNGAQINKIK